MKNTQPILLENKIRGAIINIVLWSILTVIWTFLGISRLSEPDELWIAIVNFVVAALSLVDVILNAINLRKFKKALAEKSEENQE